MAFAAGVQERPAEADSVARPPLTTSHAGRVAFDDGWQRGAHMRPIVSVAALDAEEGL